MELGIYKNIKVVNRSTDTKLKVAPIEGFQYASELRHCLITINEFYEAAKSQPIVFSKQQDTGNYFACALMGLTEGSNLFVNKDGSWRTGEYVPAFVRRYPFIFVEHDGDNLSLAIDHDHKAVNKRKGEALFDGEGEATAYTNQVMSFMTLYQQSSIHTQEMIKMLDEKGLLEEATAKIVQNGEESVLTGFMRVNEEKLATIDDSDMLDLVKTGAYKWVVAHLMSLSNFRKLLSFSGQ
jgi:hypothetical protein